MRLRVKRAEQDSSSQAVANDRENLTELDIECVFPSAGEEFC